MKSLGFISLLLFASLCHAQALYKVTFPEGNGISSVGSGTGISEHHILTNAHVVDHNVGLNHIVYISGGDVQRAFSGKVIAVNDNLDLAIIHVDGLLQRFVHIGQGPIFGKNYIFRGISSGTQQTKIIQSNGYMDSQFKVKVTELECNCIPGDSGGGVYDEDNNLVAVNWGSDGSHAHTVSIDYFNEWLPVVETACGPLGCTICGPRNNSRPVYVKPVNPPLPPQPTPANPITNPNLEDDIADKVYQKILVNIDKFRGPAGKDGLNGKDGFSPVVDLQNYVTIDQLNQKLAELSAKQGQPLVLPVQTIDKAGNVIQEGSIPLDNKHALQLITK